ncbi:hypothetical protein [Coleofasciculus sp. F4-SAH-05]|uniref:hypothetical protein n=1 Tax=Coleofasciculus sp. F4-SAH-05 TaxID=3069525 RepID=UPI003301A4B6
MALKICIFDSPKPLIYRSGVAHLNWWIRIFWAHGVRPENRQNLSYNFSCVSPVGWVLPTSIPVSTIHPHLYSYSYNSKLNTESGRVL